MKKERVNEIWGVFFLLLVFGPKRFNLGNKIPLFVHPHRFFMGGFLLLVASIFWWSIFRP